jgi:methionyl aminopeptidase
MIIYTREEIGSIKKSNEIVAKILAELGRMITPGVQTKELDEYAEMRVKELNAIPAFKGYRGYPASLCTSINEEIVHGIPSSRSLREGDIISIDFGALYEGYYGDAAATFPVGEITPKAQKLIRAAEETFYKGMEQMKPGKRISDISSAIQSHVESQGFSVIRAFVGHGIGLSLHEEPQVPEPMIAMGDWDVEILDDNWTAITRDRSLSAHYEHTVAITEKGPEILSLSDEEKKNAPYLKENQYA